MSPARSRSRSDAGSSIVELMIVTGLLGVALLAAGSATDASTKLSAELVTKDQLAASAGRALERVAAELSATGSALLVPDPSGPSGAHELDFQQVLGVTDGAVDRGSTMRIGLEFATGEIDDGTDNDRDGLIDECSVVLTHDVDAPAQRRTVLCTNVREMSPGEALNGVDDDGDGRIDERGFDVERAGELLTIRLTLLQARNGSSRTHTAETSVRLRN